MVNGRLARAWRPRRREIGWGFRRSEAPGSSRAGRPLRPSRGPRVEAAGLTDVGLERKSNQDQFLIASLSRALQVESSSLARPGSGERREAVQGKLLLVADGMGGHKHGELASAVVLEGIARHVLSGMGWLLQQPEAGVDHSEQILAELGRACSEAERLLFLEADARGLTAERPGTTLTVAYLVWPQLFVAHVGDSRCYLFRRGDLTRLTRDHTLAEEMQRRPLARGVEPSARFAHGLVNAVGGGARADPALRAIRLEHEDRVLLATDGLTRHLDDARLAALLDAEPTPGTCVRRLVEAAKQEGGRDNITAVLARVLEA